MNIFVVHSGADKEEVMRNVVTVIEEQHPMAEILVLKNGGPLWKIEAGNLLRQAQMVLFAVGENSYSSPNIDWELRKALKYNKLVVAYKLHSDCQLNNCLYGEDRFSKRKKLLAEQTEKLDDVLDRIDRYENGEYKLFNTGTDEMDRGELLEQYKIFLETSENLVARRQTVNSFYISANTALVTIMATLLTLFGQMEEKLLVCALVSAVGMILSFSWYNILDAYGTLNSSKMRVISMIERELPAALYDTEWDVMSDKLNSKKYTSFTDSEKKAPKVFIVLYAVLILVALIVWVASLF